MNRIAAANFLMSIALTALGVYDTLGHLVSYGILELWIGGGCFVAGIHCLNPKRSRARSRS